MLLFQMFHGKNCDKITEQLIRNNLDDVQGVVLVFVIIGSVSVNGDKVSLLRGRLLNSQEVGSNVYRNGCRVICANSLNSY